VLRPDYPLETARLTLRPFSPDDLDELYAFHARPEVARFLYWEARDREQVRLVLDGKTGQSALDEGEVLALAVVWRERGTLVGEVSLSWLSREHRQGEIGFVFHPGYQGRGFAGEAAEVVLRLGMRREAHFVHPEIFKGEWGDVLVYAMLEQECKDRQAGRS
jgi:RimJ/RimL family protein N-acetyltransferase